MAGVAGAVGGATMHPAARRITPAGRMLPSPSTPPSSTSPVTTAPTPSGCRCRSGRRAAIPRRPRGARWFRQCSRSTGQRCCAGGPPVDLQPDASLAHIARLRCGVMGPMGALVKALANAPGAALLFSCRLQVAAGHVQAHGVAVDVQAHQPPQCSCPLPMATTSSISWCRLVVRDG